MTHLQKTRLRTLALVWFVLILGAFFTVILTLWGYSSTQYDTPPQIARVAQVLVDSAPSATESQDAASAHALVNTDSESAEVTLRVPAAPPESKGAPHVTYAHQHVAPGQPSMPDGTAHVIPVSIPSGDAVPTHKGPIRIAIILDDMGLAVKNSHRAAALPAPVTLSYMTYAPGVQAQVDAARKNGHEIMMHMPMEPLARDLNAGPGALTTRLSPDELRAQLVQNLGAFTGYVGVNNHMGSRLTSTPEAMDVVMETLSGQGVYFVDSWTAPSSVAYEKAADDRIPRARRDVFLDHYDGEENVWRSLGYLEKIARRQGSAIAIGHPKNDTLNVLAQWLPQARARGIEIVPMSKLIYAGDVAHDPVLIADAARKHQRTAAVKAANIAPAAGE